jgi:SAM-dependent methyltransferase
MPAAQGVEVWPAGAKNLSCLVEDEALPFPNALFDRVLAAHALEESDDPLALLREVGRVMAPSGRLIVAVTARHGLWANADTTPFGQGRPFSRRQLERLMREAELEPLGWTRALYAPPLKGAHRWAEAFEQVGARLLPPFAGVILMEAAKRSFALIPKALRERVRATPVFQPAPPAPA